MLARPLLPDVDASKLLMELLVKLTRWTSCVDLLRQCPDLEGLYLKLKLEDEQEFEHEELVNLTLEEKHLREVPAERLCQLAEQLDDNDLAEQGSYVAMFAAAVFESAGEMAESAEASVLAFRMDPSNPGAASGLVSVLESMQGRCEELEERCQGLELFRWPANGRRPHCVLPFQGHRLPLVF